MKKNGNEIISKSAYWQPHKLLLSNTDADVYITTGGRGIGKTYGLKKEMIKRYLEYGDQFIYLRRRQKKGTNNKSLLVSMVNEFPDYEFKVAGSELMIRKAEPEIEDENDKNYEFETMGYALYLTDCADAKSAEYENVVNVWLDEFQRDGKDKQRDRYYTGEFSDFCNFFESVTRNRKHKERKPRIFLSSNAKSKANPYFEGFNIFPTNDIIQRYNINTPNRTIKVVLEQIEGAEFREEKLGTLSGALLWLCDDGGSAINNEYIEDNLYYIAKRDRTKPMKFLCNIVMNGKGYSVWDDKGTYYVDKLYMKDSPKTYTPNSKDIKPKVIYVQYGRSNPIIYGIWYKYITEGMVFYDLKTKNEVLEALRKWGLLRS